ncbi:MAG: alkaline phosphatase D family protein [Planctomycetes bacterium]|nr:alkaline phosphatase D family protein [Planctomycetota bacterium]
MNRLAIALSAVLLPFVSLAAQGAFQSSWQAQADAVWLGPDYWPNRLQDWQLRGGRAENVRADLPMRTLHLVTWRSANARGTLTVRVRLGRVSDGEAPLPQSAFAGLLVGAGGPDLDPRAASLVQSAPGPGGGCVFGVDGAGRLFVRQNLAADSRLEAEAGLKGGAAALDGVMLELKVAASGRKFATLTGKATTSGGEPLAEVELARVPMADVLGNLALVSHRGERQDRARFWFDRWRVEGPMLEARPEFAFGPIVAAFHTLSRGTLKLTAVMAPCVDDGGGEVALELQRSEQWSTAGTAKFAAPDYTAVFTLRDWDAAVRVPYRLRFGDVTYEGTLRPEPTAVGELRLGALTCVHQVRHGFGRAGYPWSRDALWYPHADLCARLEQQDPDILFFAGDQIYEGASPTPPSRGDDAGLDYLYKWYLFCQAFRDVARERPTIVIPDDHDVFQGNLWGAGGRHTDRDHKGGYVMPAEWVRLVERTQTSHLPDPVDPAPVEQGIGVYFTSVCYGGVDFAVLEDRKFKSGPAGLVPHDGPRPDHITDTSFDVRKADVPGAVLLGERQLAFLGRWARDWDGVELKAVLSQTIFANVATHHGPKQDFLVADLDSNGWPQSGRNRALAAIRKAFAPMIAGDQHLATLVRHGIDAYRDAGFSFCVPAMANFYQRSWRPGQPGGNQEEGMPENTGDYLDGLGNMITVLATTNVDGPSGHEPAALHDLNPGYGIVVFDTAAHTIRFECWPRWADPKSDPEYPGWPVTIQQTDNYGRRPLARLPRLAIEGVEHPVVVVEDARGELVYALRLASTSFRPPVFAPGTYRVTVSDGSGDPARAQVLELTAGNDPDASVEIKL